LCIARTDRHHKRKRKAEQQKGAHSWANGFRRNQTRSSEGLFGSATDYDTPVKNFRSAGATAARRSRIN
jgi:hypothetical protein